MRRIAFLLLLLSQLSACVPIINTVAPGTTETPPTAVDHAYLTDEDIAVASTLTGSDPNAGDVLSYSVVVGPLHGSLSGTAPDLTYTPNAHFFGSDFFTYKINDAHLDSNTATISLTVSHVNHAPVAGTQSIVVDKNVAHSVTLSASDSDSADVLSYAVVASPSHGTLSGIAPNLTFTPANNFIGSDSFTFKANDGTVNSNTATISLTIGANNQAPLADNHNYTTNEDVGVSATLSGSDPEGDTLSYAIVTNPSHGTLSGSAPNLTYTPNALYFGADSFTYKTNDGNVDSNAATVSLTISHVNHAPIAGAQSLSVNDNATLSITLGATDSDSGDTLTYAVVANPSHGSLSGIAPNLTYTPSLPYNGSDSFTFRANDGTVNSNTATISISVTHINHAPVASGQSVTTASNTAKAITLSATDSDAGDALTYAVVSGPSHGSLTGTAPNITYTSTGGYVGSDSFTFKANDGVIDSNTATVSLTVKHPGVFVQFRISDQHYSGDAAESFDADNTSGDLIVVAVQWINTGDNIANITDTNGNTYTLIPGSLGGIITPNYASGIGIQLAYAVGIAAGPNTVNVHWTGTGGGHAYAFVHLVELQYVTAFDQTATANASSGATTSAGSVTTTADGEVAISFMSSDGQSATTPGTGWDNQLNQSAGYAQMCLDTIDQTSAGPINDTVQSPSNLGWVSSIATFKP